MPMYSEYFSSKLFDSVSVFSAVGISEYFVSVPWVNASSAFTAHSVMFAVSIGDSGSKPLPPAALPRLMETCGNVKL
jgi:hypothetical protein